MTISLLKFPIGTKLYKLLNVLLHHGTYKSKRLRPVTDNWEPLIPASHRYHITWPKSELYDFFETFQIVS